MPANKSGPAPKKKKGRRGRLVLITVVLLLVAGIGFGAFWGVTTVRASYPETTGSLKLPGLSNPVDVTRDAHGIPQIYADTDEDLFRAQGFVQAQDRFWEMDVRRHMTSGRLSEMFGKGQVKTDSFLRTLGWHDVAQKEYDTKLSPSTKKYLQAYSAGVNAYLKDHEGSALSLEYAALDFDNDYKPREVDAGRLGGLAQGHGLGPARQHAGRDRPLPDDQSLRRRSRSTSCTRSTRTGGTSRSSTAARSTRPPRSSAPRARPTAPRRASATPPPASSRSSPRCPRPSTRSRHCSAPTAAASAPTPGSSPVSTPPPANRCSPTTRTSRRRCPRSGTRWACTAAPQAPSATTTSPVSPSPECPASSSATTRTSPGA